MTTLLVILGVYLILSFPFAIVCGRCLAYGSQDARRTDEEVRA